MSGFEERKEQRKDKVEQTLMKIGILQDEAYM
jgi:hypothetical protein